MNFDSIPNFDFLKFNILIDTFEVGLQFLFSEFVFIKTYFHLKFIFLLKIYKNLYGKKSVQKSENLKEVYVKFEGHLGVCSYDLLRA